MEDGGIWTTRCQIGIMWGPRGYDRAACPAIWARRCDDRWNWIGHGKPTYGTRMPMGRSIIMTGDNIMQTSPCRRSAWIITD